MSMIDASSRRLTVAIFLLTLAVGSVMYLFDVVQPGVSPAEKAYLRGWREMVSFNPFRSDDGSDYTVHFRRAFQLRPKVERYQLSLVQAWMSDTPALKRLLKDKRLTPAARATAEYFVAVRDGRPLPTGREWKVSPSEVVRRLETAKRLDPNNAVPCYAQALIYYDLKNEREAASAVRQGKSRAVFREYGYVEPRFRGTIAGRYCAERFEEYARRREVARCQLVYANRLCRQRNITEAIRVLEDTTELGLRQAAGCPRSIMNYLVGSAIFQIGQSLLAPIYKDFGMVREHEKLKQTSESFRDGNRRNRAYLYGQGYWDMMFNGRKSPMVLLNMWAFVTVGACATCALLLLACLYGAVVWVVRRRRGQEAFHLPVWRPWRLERALLISIGVPLCLSVAAAVIMGAGASLYSLSYIFELVAWAPMVAGGLAVFLTLLVSLIVVRREYAAQEGKTGWLRFMFRLSPAQAVWRSRQLAGAFLMSLFLFVWIGMVLTIVQRPLLGAYPWQQELTDLGIGRGEEKLVTDIVRGMPK